MMTLYQDWLDAKAAEKSAIDLRRSIEDQMIRDLNISPALDGTETVEEGGYKVKVTGRMNRKIDADKLQEIAAESGLAAHLGNLFRWKPELNMSAWKSADSSITAQLLGAITTTPGRPSFSIEKE